MKQFFFKKQQTICLDGRENAGEQSKMAVTYYEYVILLFSFLLALEIVVGGIREQFWLWADGLLELPVIVSLLRGKNVLQRGDNICRNHWGRLVILELAGMVVVVIGYVFLLKYFQYALLTGNSLLYVGLLKCGISIYSTYAAKKKPADYLKHIAVISRLTACVTLLLFFILLIV